MEEAEEQKAGEPDGEAGKPEEEKPKKRPLVTTRLSMIDQARLEAMCKLEGKTQTEIVRRAVLEMLDRQEQGMAAEIKDNLAVRLKKMEDRMAALMARMNMDIGTMYQIMWIRTDQEKREKMWAAAKSAAAKRASKKLEGEDLERKEQIRDEISS